MMKKSQSIVIVSILCIFIPSILCSETVVDIGNYSLRQRQLIVDTPMIIKFECEIIHYFQNCPILKMLPDNKVEIVISDNTSKGEDSKPKTLITEFSEKFNLPYTVTKKNISIIRSKKCVRLEEDILGNSRSGIIEVYDGKDTKLFKHSTLTSVDGKKTIETKYGQIFPDREENKIYRFYPFDLWPVEEFKPTYPLEQSDDGLFKIKIDDNSGTFEFMLSPSDNYMKRSHHISRDKYSEELKVNKTVNIGNLVLPADVEINQYKGEKLLPERLTHYTNFVYEIITEEKAKSLCIFEFPKGTKMGKIISSPY